MRRFILIDQSISGLGGHYYEYATRVLDAAQRAGMHPVLATNRSFKAPQNLPYAVYPCYRYAFFSGAQPASKGLRERLHAWWFRCRGRVKYSKLGLLWTIRGEPKALVNWLDLLPAESKYGRHFELLFLYLLYILRATGGYCWALVPLNTYLRGSYRRRLHSAWQTLVEGLLSPFSRAGWGECKRSDLGSCKIHAFAQDTRRLFKDLEIQSGDVVFIPTLGAMELAGLARFFRQEPRASRLTWHLLFRRNIFDGRDPEYSLQLEQTRTLRSAFWSFRQLLQEEKVCFYTDTQELTNQYNRLNIFPFRSLPVPVVDERAHRATSSSGPLRVVYLGDARPEKGYQHLPHLVRDLWLDCVETGRLTFVFQSSYNSSDGEPEAVVARAELDGMPADKVELLRQPLSSTEYRQLLLRADIMLILYESQRYYARSSGVFAEALSAGIPPVIPAATWMSLQLIEPNAQYHAQLARQFGVRTILGADLKWWISSPDEARRLEQDRLSLRGQGSQVCVADVPAKSSHLLISFEQCEPDPGQFARLVMKQLGASSGRTHICSHIMGGGGSRRVTLLLKLTNNPERVILAFSNITLTSPLDLCRIRLEFLRSPLPLPLGAVGAIYSSNDQIAECVRELAEHHSHYRLSAEAFGERWSAYQNADVLVDEIRQGCLVPSAVTQEAYPS